MELNILIFAFTETFPEKVANELGLRLRIASESAEKNIAEGLEFRGRMTKDEFRKLLGLAQNSLHEVGTRLIAAKDLLVGDQELLTRAESLRREISMSLDSINPEV